MEVALSPEWEQYLDEQVRRGRYKSTAEAITTAVALLKSMQEAETRLEALLLEAEDSGPASEMVAGDWAEIGSEGLRRFRQGTTA